MFINKLSVQTGLIFLLGTTIVVGGLSWHQYSDESERLPIVAQRDAVESTRLIATSVSNEVLYRKAFPLWKQMKRIKERFNDDNVILREFAVLDDKHLVLTHSDAVHYPVMKQMPVPADGAVWNGHDIQVVQSVLHPSDGRVIGVVILTFDASSIDAELAKLRQEIGVSMAFAMLVALLIAIGMSFRVSAPLQRLSRLAAHIGDGEVEIKSFRHTPDEIKALAVSMQQADQAIIAKNRQLIENEALLKSLIDNSPAVIFIKDLEGRYILINSRYEDIFNIRHEDIVGKTDADVFDASLAAALSKHDEEVIERGDAMVLEESVPDRRGLRHYYSLKFPLYDTHKKMYAVCGIATDITDQKASSAQISKLATVVDQADEIIVVTNADGIIEYVNPAFERISGYSAEEVLG
ncbi:PAS domain-containing protein [Mariprofundus sp. EBB-1]|uniref:PAS domain-containing protein n=1 Tax=Mariprofundus sp. EBB-1 TaxID=2650971 RepID=UPI00137A6258|nr:PAS domain-containing protein [Mariprofundus sp. EBB-1]